MSTPFTESGTGSEAFTFAERVSMLFGVEASALSAMSIVLMIGYKIYRSIKRARAGTWEEDACDSSLFLTLMLGETLRAIGKIMSVRWIIEAEIVAPSTYCTSQGVIQLLGTNIIDWSTLAITVQTTVILISQSKAPEHFTKYLAVGVWVIVSFIIGLTLGVRGLGIIGPAGSWCWLQAKYRAEQIVSEYLWMWIILILTMIFYVIDALVVMGFLKVEGWRLHWATGQRIHVSLTQAENTQEVERKEMAKQLLFYPLVYFVCVTPFSITRWLAFSGHFVPHQASAFTTCLFSLSGLFNVILFFKTRPALITGGDIVQPRPVDGQANHQPPFPPNQYHEQSGLAGKNGYGHATISGPPSTQRQMAEKIPTEEVYIEIDYSQRTHSPSRHMHRKHLQISPSPTHTPTKYQYDANDRGGLPPV